MLRKILFIIVAFFIIIYSGAVFADGFDCTVIRVLDGDTFEVETIRGKLKIRVWGVDTPEVPPKVTMEVAKKNGGMKAKEAMKKLLLYQKLNCIPISGSYDRVVCQCFLNSNDIGVYILKNNLGIEDVGYSKHYYKEIRKSE